MSGTSTVELLLRLVVSMAIVIGLMVGITVVLRRRGIGGFAPARGRRPQLGVEVEVLARRPLGRNASIAVVRAGSKSLVLGVTDSTVTMLTETEIEEIEIDTTQAQGTGLASGPDGPNPTWKTMLDGLRDRTVRRT